MSESQLGERNAEKIGVYRVRKLMVYICPKSGEDRWCLLRQKAMKEREISGIYCANSCAYFLPCVPDSSETCAARLPPLPDQQSALRAQALGASFAERTPFLSPKCSFRSLTRSFQTPLFVL